MRSELDHIVVACTDLDQGAAWLRDRLGVEPQPGGQHAAMGTHNRLLKLGPRVYLELIAIDPNGVAPARPRWFDLDSPEMKERLAASPQLITWVARCDDIVEAVTRVPAVGDVHALARGPYRWRITIPDDGSLQFGGMLPTVIQWEGTEATMSHPADALEDRGCMLVELKLSYPAASSVLPLYRALRVSGPIDLVAGPKRFVARVRTPNDEIVELQ
jgi:hypothetical protein